MKIKKNRPIVSSDAPLFRKDRRRYLDRPYVEVKIGPMLGNLCIGLFAASMTMAGLTLGAFLRLAGF
jgi:hypothetical protein